MQLWQTQCKLRGRRKEVGGQADAQCPSMAVLKFTPNLCSVTCYEPLLSTVNPDFLTSLTFLRCLRLKRVIWADFGLSLMRLLRRVGPHK